MVRVYLALWTCLAASATAAEWTPLSPLPDSNGFAGCFAGVSSGALLVAGGANFPGKKPWEGGTKVWYETVFVLNDPHGQWKTAGQLPRPLAYGVSVTHREGVVCVGGSDAASHYAEAFRLGFKAGKLLVTPLPSLPKPLACACGAMVGEVLYVAGGQEKPDAVTASPGVFALDLAAAQPRWREVEACPGGGRIFAVAAAFDGAFWVVGGANIIVGKDGKPERRYLKDVYCYRPGQGWKRVANLPHALAAAPSPAPIDATGFYVLGGDDGTQVATAPDRHRGFARTILHYNAAADRWAEAGERPTGTATAPVTRWDNAWVIPSGEIRPGVRSPEVWRWTLGKQE